MIIKSLKFQIWLLFVTYLVSTVERSLLWREENEYFYKNITKHKWRHHPSDWKFSSELQRRWSANWLRSHLCCANSWSELINYKVSSKLYKNYFRWFMIIIIFIPFQESFVSEVDFCQLSCAGWLWERSWSHTYPSPVLLVSRKYFWKL